MLKVAYTSDLHVDITPMNRRLLPHLVRRVAQPNPDLPELSALDSRSIYEDRRMMSVPSFETFLLPVLQEVAGGNDRTRKIIASLAKRLQSTGDDGQEPLTGEARSRLYGAVNAAVNCLKWSGLLEDFRSLRITRRGREVLASRPLEIDAEYLMQFPGFQELCWNARFFVPDAIDHPEWTAGEVLDRLYGDQSLGRVAYITCRDHWADDGPEISYWKWCSVARGDREIRVEPVYVSYIRNTGHYCSREDRFIWKAHPTGQVTMFCWSDGNVEAIDPDSPTLGKMQELAAKLGANVQADDGEVFERPGGISHAVDGATDLSSRTPWWTTLFRKG